MADWSDKFNVLKSGQTEPVNFKQWRWAIEESKTKGTLQLNIRLFSLPKTEGGYSGPTKNGFIIPINDLEELQSIKLFLKDAFEAAEKYLK